MLQLQVQGLEYPVLQTDKKYTTPVFIMSEADIAVILNRLDQLEETLRQIHGEVRRTNGRVTALEKQEAMYQGEEKAKEMQKVIATSVLSGGLLAGMIWVIAYLAR